MKEKFKYKKEYGQNFLINEEIISKIVKSSNVSKNDLVIEIGPGMGVLSKKIIPISKYSILYEIDERLESKLRNDLKENDNYSLFIKDFLEANLIEDINLIDTKCIKVVANLPYYITTPILRKLILEIYPDEIIIMIQKEVADRFTACVNTKEYGYITVYLNSFYKVEKLFDVTRDNFNPIPNVDSTVIRFKKNEAKIDNRENFDKIIKESFKYKRKNLKNNLKQYDLKQIENILKKNGYSLKNRAEEIPLEVFIELSNEIV